MKKCEKLETERLLLRQWKLQDFPVFAKLNADPDVMEFFPSTLSREESDFMAGKIRQLIDLHGWGFWAVEEKASGSFIGFVGLNEPEDRLPFTPCVEIGWRLAKEYWGKGYATEAGKEALSYAFDVLKQKQVFAFTAIQNKRSRAVMERLNMRNTHENFEHPRIPPGHHLREHVLYRITRKQWLDVGHDIEQIGG